MRPDISAFIFYDSEYPACTQVISRQSGFDLQFSNGSSTLLTFAEAYFYLSYSVIPLIGDTDLSRAKVPAIPWTTFQQHRASLNDYAYWFTKSEFGGLGIVTGRISQLVVLDFDSDQV